MKTAERLASSIGKGLVAGFAGTAAMTVSSTLEARLRGRAPSTAPARATAKALGIASFEDGVAQTRFNDLSHWGYGTGWGIVRGLLNALGVPPAKATAAHGAAIWGSAQVTLPALEIAPPIVFWPAARSRSTPSITPCTRSQPGSPTKCSRAAGGARPTAPPR